MRRLGKVSRWQLRLLRRREVLGKNLCCMKIFDRILVYWNIFIRVFVLRTIIRKKQFTAEIMGHFFVILSTC
jgi:hypothetical protein